MALKAENAFDLSRMAALDEGAKGLERSVSGHRLPP